MKVCVMNCGPSTRDMRSRADVMRDCQDCEDWPAPLEADPFDFEDLGPRLHDAHVSLFHGFDLTSRDPLFRPEMAACPFCDAMSPGDAPDELLLTEEWRHDRYVHYIICGCCGACGPTERTESRAVQAWNVVGGGWFRPAFMWGRPA